MSFRHFYPAPERQWPRPTRLAAGMWGQSTSAMLILAGAVSIVLSGPVFLGFLVGVKSVRARHAGGAAA